MTGMYAPPADPPGDVEGLLVGDCRLLGVDADVLSTSSPTDDDILCVVAFKVLAPSESGDRSVETAKGTLFRSTNLNAGSFEGL